MKNIFKISFLLVVSLSFFSCEEIIDELQLNENNNSTIGSFKSTSSLVGESYYDCNSGSYVITSGEATITGTLIMNNNTANINFKEVANQLTITRDNIEYQGTINNSINIKNLLFIITSDNSKTAVIKESSNIKIQSKSGEVKTINIKSETKIVINANGDIVVDSFKYSPNCG